MKKFIFLISIFCLFYSCGIFRQIPIKSEQEDTDYQNTEIPPLNIKPTLNEDSVKIQQFKLQRESYTESIQNINDLITKIESNKTYSVSKEFIPKLKSMKKELENLQNEVDSLNNLILTGKLILDIKNIEFLKIKEKERKQRAEEVIRAYNEIKKNENLDLDTDKNIYFGTDKYLYTDLNYQGKIDLIELLKKINSLYNTISSTLSNRKIIFRIRVWGYADGQGEDEYNQNLSERRAYSIYNYIRQNFNGANILEKKDVKGLGETNVPRGVEYPIYDNEENWKRRTSDISVRIYSE